jgi:hypothetical protein
MRQCSFELNGKSMSAFKMGASSFPAFSGLGDYANKRPLACTPNLGAIPPGRYYILDRPSGGRLGWLRDLVAERDDWFALYAVDGKSDDETWCEKVKRGQFRLHPKGRRGISEGCIVLDKQADFQLLRSRLRAQAAIHIPEANIDVWAEVVVR